MSALLRLVPAGASALLLIAGCGGTVVLAEDGDEGGNAGSGAAGPGSGPGPGSTGSLNTSATTSTGQTTTSCDQICGPHRECFEGGQSCLEQCQALYVPGCEQATDAMLLCYAGVVGRNCETPDDACFSQEQAFYQCQNANQCQQDSCAGSKDGCDCFGDCFGTQLEAACFFTSSSDPDPPTTVSCECFANGELLGTCPMDDLVCDLDAGCCKNFLLEG